MEKVNNAEVRWFSSLLSQNMIPVWFLGLAWFYTSFAPIYEGICTFCALFRYTHRYYLSVPRMCSFDFSLSSVLIWFLDLCYLGIDKETFLQYFPLNGLLGDRLFAQVHLQLWLIYSSTSTCPAKDDFIFIILCKLQRLEMAPVITASLFKMIIHKSSAWIVFYLPNSSYI